MKEYLLLFRGGDAGRELQKSPELWQQHMMKWKTWMDGVAQQGKFVGAQPLTANGTIVKGTQKQVIDGPYAEGKEMVGGYMLVKVSDMQEAIEISKGCPILETDGNVEVREVQAM